MRKTPVMLFLVIILASVSIIGISITHGIISIPISDEVKIKEIELEVHHFTNIERQKHGLAPLSYNDQLSHIARSHSKDMLERDYFSHDTPEGCDPLCRYNKQNYSCPSEVGVKAGENLHWWQYEDNIFWQSPEEIGKDTVQSWMSSPAHRENILFPYYESEGVGVVITFYESYITQNFC